jgi:hypothetical protein
MVSHADVLGAVGQQLCFRPASIWLAHHATPPAEAEIFGVWFTDRPPAMATPLNEPREGEVKTGWPRLHVILPGGIGRSQGQGSDIIADTSAQSGGLG